MTIKQQLAMKNVVGNGGNITKAMLDAGYSPNTANTPQKLTESTAWQELMEKFLPDERLIKKIHAGLEATKIHTSHTEPDREVTDWIAQHKFLETALRLKGKGDEPSQDVPNMVVFNIYGNNQSDGSLSSTTETIESTPDTLSTGV